MSTILSVHPRSLLVASLAMLAAGCGGGGGGGSPDVRLESATSSVPQPRKSYADATSPGASIIVTFGGDLDWLYDPNHEWYVYLLMPEPIVFGENLTIEAGPDPATQLVLRVPGVDGLEPGQYSGDLEVHACFDAACEHEFANSPLLVHYESDVMHLLELSETSVSASAPFGTPVATRRFAVNLPEGTSSWGVQGYDHMHGIRAAKAGDGSAAVDVDFPLLPPGHYTWTFSVDAWAPDPAGFFSTQREFNVPFDVVYDVTANPGVPFALSATEFTYDVSPTCMDGYDSFSIVRQDPADTSPISVSLTYDAHPAEAEGVEGNDYWVFGLSASGESYDLDPCHFVPLPAGTYRATVHYTHPNGGTPYEVDHAMTMVIP